ncbi:YqgQ family protein [Enterococcus dongliensis]|uniref:YqgQ family protein n=1 Tax=Enterococcus dongliensis TaxID=2559925 RepID=A0AAP5KU94_9ENTE|nr:YqgQ family protein [Enterococcus dongliensis]MDT2597010.1 YqgQ family protein [Enterococcus dongliensis]MDT2603030.1 YqgQ family protein [Enterococcus dongliensis]MDT2612412.1 YqgQ family protein [Enterococcus dongliensis]MDT2633374.1 YqgQ family protein [Enterococcus dongliensis]MDT2636725.1 YqgQ family protein [Enterococcus dongliensis]
MKSLYDVQQLLKQFGIYVYVGKRIYDIELMQIELKNLYESRVIDRDTYLQGWGILKREHHIEESREGD